MRLGCCSMTADSFDRERRFPRQSRGCAVDFETVVGASGSKRRSTTVAWYGASSFILPDNPAVMFTAGPIVRLETR